MKFSFSLEALCAILLINTNQREPVLGTRKRNIDFKITMVEVLGSSFHGQALRSEKADRVDTH